MSQVTLPQIEPLSRVRLVWLVIVSLFLLPCGGCMKRLRSSSSEVETAEASQKDSEDAAVALGAEFEKTRDEAAQIELVQELAINASSVARTQLERIYRATPNLRVKSEIIQSLAFIESENLEPSLVLLRDAVKPGQPAELREAAIGTLLDLNNPATLPVWKLLLNDPDAESREAAQHAVEYYSIFEPATPWP